MARAHPCPLVQVGSVKLLGLSSFVRDARSRGPGDHVLPALTTGSVGVARGGCSGSSLSGRPALSLSTCCIVRGRGWTDAGFPYPRACRSYRGTLAGGVAQTALPLAVGCGFMWAAGSFLRDWDFLTF